MLLVMLYCQLQNALEDESDIYKIEGGKHTASLLRTPLCSFPQLFSLVHPGGTPAAIEHVRLVLPPSIYHLSGALLAS